MRSPIALRLKLCICRMTWDKSPQKAGRHQWLV